MNKEIKFRAWDKRNERWEYFVIYPTDENREYTISFGSKIYNFLIEEKRLDRESWGQFTGLKDKNDKEIYKGDIVKFMSEENLIVEFYKAHFIICPLDRRAHEDLWKALERNDVEIVGNIYENSELLEAKENKQLSLF